MMQDELEDTAREYRELQERVREIDEEIEDLRRDMFGAESEGTERKARELFSEVGSSGENTSKTAEIDDLREEKQKLEEELKTVRERLLKFLVDVSFPLNEEINTSNGTISFPYSQPIEQKILDGITDVLSVDLDAGDVTIGSEAIEVNTESVDDAIDAVQQRVTKLRDSAEALLDVDSHVEAVYDRDPKVAAMLYVLDESEESLTKKQMEQQIGLDAGELRGQLYHVVKNDPYLRKNGQDVTLTSTGEKVIHEYVSRYGIPTLLSDKSEDDSDGDQEVVA